MVTVGGSSTPEGDRRVRRPGGPAGALIQLVEEQDLSRISVADVAEQAGVSRTAFYDHYRDVHELAEAACTAMIDNLIESLPALDPGSADPAPDPTQSLEAFFANLAEHAGLYRSLLGPQGSARVIDHIRSRITAAIHDSPYAPDRRRRAGAHRLADGHPARRPRRLHRRRTHRRGRRLAPARMPADTGRDGRLTWPLLAALHHLDVGTPTCRQLP